MSYTNRQILNFIALCHDMIDFSRVRIFREGALDAPLDAIRTELLPLANETSRPEKYVRRAKRLFSKGELAKLDDNSVRDNALANMLKIMFKTSPILNKDSISAAASWHAFRDELSQIFAHLAAQKPATDDRNANRFLQANMRIRQTLASCFYRFCGQLSKDGHTETVDTIYQFLKLGYRVTQTEGNHMDVSAVAVVLAPSMLHGLQLDHAIAPLSDDPKKQVELFKNEYQFVSFAFEVMLKLPIYGDRATFAHIIHDQDQRASHVFYKNRYLNTVWSKEVSHDSEISRQRTSTSSLIMTEMMQRLSIQDLQQFRSEAGVAASSTSTPASPRTSLSESPVTVSADAITPIYRRRSSGTSSGELPDRPPTPHARASLGTGYNNVIQGDFSSDNDSDTESVVSNSSGGVVSRFRRTLSSPRMKPKSGDSVRNH